MKSLAATFHLTHDCNLRCTYCYTGEKFKKEMSHETASHAVDFCLQEAGSRYVDLLEVVFFGGEPLMKYDLLTDIAKMFYERRPENLHLSFKMSTNGTLLTPERIRELAHLQVFVSMSIDGGPKVIDAQRPQVNGKSPWLKLEKIIPEFIKYNPCANVQCVVTPQSASVVDESIKWIYDLGFSYISIAIDYTADWKRDDMRQLKAALQRAGEWYVGETLKEKKFYLNCFDETINTHAKNPVTNEEKCTAGVGQFSISASGKLYPCVQFVKEDENDSFVIGDIYKGLMDSKVNHFSSCASASKPECSGCAIEERCSNWCSCISWSTTGQLNGTSPVLCEYQRILMPIADSVANSLWKKKNPVFIHKHYNEKYPFLNFAETAILQEVE